MKPQPIDNLCNQLYEQLNKQTTGPQVGELLYEQMYLKSIKLGHELRTKLWMYLMGRLHIDKGYKIKLITRITKEK